MNNWLEDNIEQIKYFLKSNDVILVGRKYHIEILLKLMEYYKKTENQKILDFGCGDGIISKIILSKYPNNDFDLLDGSKEMISNLESNFNQPGCTIINMDFKKWVNEQIEHKYDIIFSSMAIHHLEHYDKNLLFGKIHTALKFDGLFVNIDVVKPVSKLVENFHFQMWENSILRQVNNDINAYKEHEKLSSAYKNKHENKPSTLISQLNMLQEIGFEDVDCHHKDGIFSMYSGVKK